MIRVENMTKIYGAEQVQTKALDGVSFQIEEGEFVAITGKSGCGKSSLLHILGGMDMQTSGHYFFEETEVNKLSDKEMAEFRNRKIGFVFQAFYLLEEFQTLQNIELPLGYSGWKSGKRRKRAMELLQLVGLSHKGRNHPSQLSGGEQQRIAIARAIANYPKLLLADEPTGNLDKENGERIMELLKRLNKEGLTIVMVTHDLELAKEASRIIHISDGKIV
ncbi:MAG: ABC transporter ATP-binding protein [Lachnospiraceae bacterium]|nr:ABC transporter ATP-binding protein [Lachnospiraceae bacterium]